MPYFDPLRSYVNHWYAGSEGGHAATFLRTRKTNIRIDLKQSGVIMSPTSPTAL
jgi:hypothetical protein